MPKPSACILLLLLFLLPEVSPNCQTGTTAACMNATFVPGHNLVGHGIDVTTLGWTGAYLVDTSQWHGLNGTCTLCWNLLQGGQWQRLPLAVVDWRVHSLCQWQLSSLVQPSAMGMMESAASVVQNDWKVGLKVPVVPKVNVQVGLAGSCSKLAKFIMQKSRKDKYAFVSQECFQHIQASNQYMHPVHLIWPCIGVTLERTNPPNSGIKDYSRFTPTCICRKPRLIAPWCS
uniref:Uncharacterized protein n=1 Tax=Gopherus agassizii TaxID=38772 RepID=A0A452IDH9_9SAUR